MKRKIEMEMGDGDGGSRPIGRMQPCQLFGLNSSISRAKLFDLARSLICTAPESVSTCDFRHNFDFICICIGVFSVRYLYLYLYLNRGNSNSQNQ